ncbi:PTS sugar transporter subunit IIA [Cupriavidus sp. KK10]|jgi:PTS system nitrogen regulatory IIA component|uniref:PTS sugar transporter subunit IIA n=1 Tax=Cupriavidus sp. KK10 TaxID=1478019 RepID=UPI002011BD8C|nr:PTS sugar transporter subunit IIA [Cupriavidus sp. KK10]
MHITIDAKHAAPPRHALIRECTDQSWSIRLAILPGGARMRLSLTLPKAAVSDAMLQIVEAAQGAVVGQLVEVPAEPTDAWRDLMRGGGVQRPDSGCQTRPLAQSIGNLLCEANVVLRLDAPDQPSLFHSLGALAAERYGLSAEVVAAALTAREALGSTGLGQGVAVPHGRIAAIPQAIAFYVRLLKPISFNAPDGEPVGDLVVLLFPDWDIYTHLHMLASVAQSFCDRHFRSLLENCVDANSVYTLFSSCGSSRKPVWH